MAEEGDDAIDPDSLLQPGGALRGRLWQELSSDLDRRNSIPPGTRIGAYVVIREIGRGGMGAVYLAERADGQFEQRVAIKVLNMETEEVVRRFGRERQILASLPHPSIARLFDGGVTEDGRSYFVMEHVDGVPIDAYCREGGLSVEERLRLFIEVAEAVQQAHRSLVVHRDLKPGNILVTAGGEVKLLDFGIAKLMYLDLARDPAPATRATTRVMTPEYASPEQVRAEPVTTASDIYQLGLLLYELLTDQRAYRLQDRTLVELERAICETQPALPSLVVSAGRLRRRLAGDLDNIVLKALRKEPERRYATAEQMVEDVRRHLASQPVRARAATLGYRVGSFVRRHRSGVTASAAVTLVLAGLVAFHTTRLAAERDRARLEAGKSARISDLLMGLFTAAHPYARYDKGEPAVRAILAAVATRVETELAGEPEVQAELRGVLGRVYTGLGFYDKAAPLLQLSLDQRRSLYGPRHVAVAEAMDQLGELLVKQRHFGQAEPLLREALAQRRQLVGSENADTAATIDNLATLFQEKDDFDTAEPLFREALAIYLGRLGEDHPSTAGSLHNLAHFLHQRGRFAEAETLYRRALAARRASFGDAHPSVTLNLNTLGTMLAREMDRLEEAETFIREALALDRQMFGEQHDYTAESLANLGTVLRLKGDFDEAERLQRQALAVNRGLFGAEHTRIASNLNNIATTMHLEGDLEGALPLFRQAQAQFERLVGEQHRNTATATINLARVLRETGKAAEAETLFRAAASRLDAAVRRERPLLITAQVGLGRALTDQGRAVEALPLLERALEMSIERFGADNWRTGEAKLALGACLAASGQHARAEPLLHEAHVTFQKHRRAQPRLALEAGAALKRVTASR